MPPDFPNMARSLLQPVIFDPWNQKKSVGTMGQAATEGAAPMKSGGGPGGWTPGTQEWYAEQAAAKQAARGTPQPISGYKITKFGGARTGDGSGGLFADKKLSNGATLSFTVQPRGPKGAIDADVAFSAPRGQGFYDYIQGNNRYGDQVPAGSGPSLKRGVGTFSEVMQELQNFVNAVKPKSLSFSPATRSHAKLYNRVAPKMAEKLGAEYARGDDGGFHVLTFPDHKKWGGIN